MWAACYTHLIFLAMITLIRYSEEYKLWTSSCNFFQPPVVTSFLLIQIFSLALCFQTPSI
jgi:hypothetical protein